MSAATGQAVPFEYALLRAVPRVDRGESVNVGVVVYCQRLDLLCLDFHVTPARVHALDAGVDLAALDDGLAHLRGICAGDPAAGPAATLPLGPRFRWLTAPRSTLVQPGPVHGGVAADPTAVLDRLMRKLVR